MTAKQAQMIEAMEWLAQQAKDCSLHHSESFKDWWFENDVAEVNGAVAFTPWEAILRAKKAAEE